MCDGVTLSLGETGETGFLRSVLPDESVGVLIGASFPGAVWSGEEEVGVGGIFDGLVAMELGAVVDGDGANLSQGVVDEFYDASVGGFDGLRLELSDHGEAGLAINESEEAVLVGTEHGVALESRNDRIVYGASSGHSVDICGAFLRVACPPRCGGRSSRD